MLNENNQHSYAIRRRPRILFVAEAVTDCHVTRPLVLAQSLNRDDYDVHFACDPLKRELIGTVPNFHPLENDRGREQFLRNLEHGKPAFNKDTLVKRAQQDIQLLQNVRPDVVVGDMRLSLACSARVFKTKYCSITNAYWSPYGKQPWTIPELPITRLLGPQIPSPFFRAVRPLAFAMHCLPFHSAIRQLRKEWKHQPDLDINLLPRPTFDLRKLYTDADEVLYADLPTLVPTSKLPHNHQYLGPILWSKPGAMPEKWHGMDQKLQAVYISLGSSGPVKLLPTLIKTLAKLRPKINILVSTSGRATIDEAIAAKPNVLVEKYLPSGEVCRHVDLAIGHGGSASAYVALAAGTPVLGIASILDQHLTIRYISKWRSKNDDSNGVGPARWLRSENATPESITTLTREMLGDERYRIAAKKIASLFSESNMHEKFRASLKQLVG